MNTFQLNSIQYNLISVQDNAFDNHVCKMSAILCKPQYVNLLNASPMAPCGGILEESHSDPFVISHYAH